MTEHAHESRRHARILMMKAAFSLRDSMSANDWIEGAVADYMAISAYDGDVEALRREATAIAALMWRG
jgi:hypothetical protein